MQQSSALLFGGYPCRSGFTRVEVFCFATFAMVFCGIISSVQSGYRAERAGYSLSAQPIEQAKSSDAKPPTT
jgi:hypothetical protein